MELTTIQLAEYQPAPWNPNTHPDAQILALMESLDTFTQFKNIVVWHGYVLAGNAVFEAAKRKGWTEIQANVRDDLTEAQAKALCLADIVLPSYSFLDMTVFEAIVTDVEDVPGLTTEWLTDHLPNYNEELPSLEGLDDIPEPETLPSRVQAGELWQLGRHRLLCGDSTNAEDVARLMQGTQADMCFTSPPYNVGNIGTGAYHDNKIGRTDFKKFYLQGSDNLSSKEYKRFLFSVLRNLAKILLDDSPLLWNVSYNAKSRSEYGEIVFSQEHPFTVKESIVWDKGLGMNIAAKGILSRTAEFIFLMSKGEKYFTNQTSQDTWWNIWRISNRDGENMQCGHGASFPVALPCEALQKFSKKLSLIVDPFLGSGTTLIACEQLGRVCYGLEISPAYCDVILSRWETLTGQTATRCSV